MSKCVLNTVCNKFEFYNSLFSNVFLNIFLWFSYSCIFFSCECVNVPLNVWSLRCTARCNQKPFNNFWFLVFWQFQGFCVSKLIVSFLCTVLLLNFWCSYVVSHLKLFLFFWLRFGNVFLFFWLRFGNVFLFFWLRFGNVFSYVVFVKYVNM